MRIINFLNDYRVSQEAIRRAFLPATFILLLLFQLSLYSGLVSAQQDRNIYQELQAPFYDPYGIGDQCGDSGLADSTAGITPGQGDPEGLTFPNLDPDAIANAVNKYIEQIRPTSPFKGLGATMTATGKQSNVNPFLFVAIAIKETQLATDNSYNVQPGRNNAFGRTASSRQPNFMGNRLWYRWVSFKASVDYKDPSHARDPSKTGDMGKYIRAVYAEYLNSNNVGEFFIKYAPPSDGNNTAQYIAQVEGWMKSMADLARGDAGGGEVITETPGATGTVPAECQPCGPDSGKKVVVLDPGHAGEGSAVETDPATGIQAIEVPNPAERRAMWQTAQQIKNKLEQEGYVVHLTKTSEDDKAGLLRKARRANALNPAIVVSLHSTPGRFGEIPAEPEHWGVTPQEVGRFRENKDNGKRKTFTNASIADKSMQYAQIIAQERNKTGDLTKVTPLDRSFPRNRAGIQAWGDISIVQLFGNAPWVYNEVGQTGFNMPKYAEGIANGIIKAVPIAAGAEQAGEAAGCVNGAVNGDVISTALNYAWPEYHAAPYTVMKPAYKLAVDRAIAAGKYVGGGSKPGIDCGGFVTRVMQDSGADQAYGGGGNTIYQKAHMDNSGKYDKITVNSTADLQPGDIAIDASHTFMYVGTQPNFETKVASASYSTTGQGWRTPMAGKEDVMSSRWSWYRLKM